jgi:ribosomal protein S18 acetylase RimI-like enzyme
MLDKFNLKLESRGFHVKETINPDEIILTGEKCGLEDVKHWVTNNHLEKLIERGLYRAYIISPIDNISNAIGLVSAGIEEEGRMWIELLGTNKRFRKQGIARSLIEILIHVAKVDKLRTIFVDVDDDNHSALVFYKKMNFKDSGIIRRYYYDNTDAIILRYDV